MNISQFAAHKKLMHHLATCKDKFAATSRVSLDDSNSVHQEITQGQETLDLGDGRVVNARSYVASFNLKGAVQEKRVSMLSGGERNRVHIAKARVNIVVHEGVL